MSLAIPRKLSSSREFRALGAVAQLVLAGVWKAGVEQRFEPLGPNTARDIILLELRQKGAFLHDSARPLYESIVDEFLSSGALREVDGGALLLPILSADRLKVPKADKALRTPEERASAEERELERVAKTMFLKRQREKGVTGTDEEILRDKNYQYTPRRHRDDVTAPVTPAVTPTPTVTPAANTAVTAPAPSLSLPLHEDSSEKERERENSKTSETSQQPRATPGDVTGSDVTDRAPVTSSEPPQAPGTDGTDGAPAPAPVVERRASPRVPESELTDEALGQQAVAILSAVPNIWRAGKTLPAVAEELGGVMRRLGFTLAHIHRVAAHWSVESPRVRHRGEKALFAWATTECRSGVSASFLAQNEGNALSIAVGAAEEFHKAQEEKAAEAEAKRRKDAEWEAAAQKARRDSASERAPPPPAPPPAPVHIPESRPGAVRAEDDPRLAQARAYLGRGAPTGTEGGE